MPALFHPDLQVAFPRFARRLVLRASEPYLVEHVLPPATDAELRSLETELGVPLPESYKRLLGLSRGFWLAGGMVQLGTQHPFFHRFPPYGALTPEQRRGVSLKGGNWPPPSDGFLCFAEFFLEGDGDQVLWDTRQGLVAGEYDVYYYAHEARPPSVRRIAPNFADWLDGCLEPFDPSESPS